QKLNNKPEARKQARSSTTSQKRSNKPEARKQARSSTTSQKSPRRPTNNRMKVVPERRKCKDKAPSEEGGKKLEVKPVDPISCVQNIMDSLTPETFQKSVTQLKQLKLETEEMLKAMISIVYERAMLAPNSSVLCTNLCNSLSCKQVPAAADPKVSVTFRTLLIRHCQAEFERNHSRDTKKDSVSNIRFVGELFKSNLLSTTGMSSCIKRLLDLQHQQSLECLCELLKAIGRDLEVAIAKRDMDLLFHRLENIRKEGKTSSRVCLMLEETANLRQRNWMPGSRVTCVNTKDTNSQASVSEPEPADPVTAPEPAGSQSQTSAPEPAEFPLSYYNQKNERSQ
uniref:MIF4G domain-containing protein n=1 Tax=Echeneis naucrates TaxID=173247 RepID=A0A665V7R1_ECHNA